MNPKISVLIPALNEEIYIGKCLNSLSNQSYPSDLYEVVVMDNGSTDRTKEIAELYGAKVIDASGLRIGGVRNIGALLTSSDVLAYIDADCIAPREWLANGIALLKSYKGVGAIGGKCDIPDDATWVERAWILDRRADRTIEKKILATGSFFILRDVFEKVGGFDTEVFAGEDTQISTCLVNRGYKLLHSTDIKVVHLGFPRTIDQFFKRQIWQSKDYIRTKKTGFDAVFFATLLFLVASIISFLSIILGYLLLTLVSTLLLIFLSILIAIYRYRKAKVKFGFVLFCQCWFLNFLYLSARSLGLFRSFLSKCV